ncbi:hypothetical protein AcW1_006183 [Taiwanofungus camphoratus]|nr:hypothetical protein AcW2_004943 [Antrodia cinnamomea]KAI0934763.1 hypothetical protein AcV5_006503 [Antrodia cinnamomea]KAI0957959.1 hypothetical protein AcW1_006183 [Antrodia cinnamomea]
MHGSVCRAPSPHYCFHPYGNAGWWRITIVLISGLALYPVLSTPPMPSPGSPQADCLIAAIRAACMIGNGLALYDRHDYDLSLRPARSPSTSYHARRSLKLERRVCGLERELARQHRLS